MSNGLSPVLDGLVGRSVESVTAGLCGQHERGVRPRQPHPPGQSQQSRPLVGVVAGAQEPQAQRDVLIQRRRECVRQLSERGRDQVVQVSPANRGGHRTLSALAESLGDDRLIGRRKRGVGCGQLGEQQHKERLVLGRAEARRRVAQDGDQRAGVTDRVLGGGHGSPDQRGMPDSGGAELPDVLGGVRARAPGVVLLCVPGRIRSLFAYERVESVAQHLRLVHVGLVQSRRRHLRRQCSNSVEFVGVSQGVELLVPQDVGVPGEPVGCKPVGQVPVYVCGSGWVAGTPLVGVGELVIETVDAQRAEQDLVSDADPVWWGSGHAGQRCAGAERLGGLPRPEAADDVGALTQHVVDLLRTPQLDVQVFVLVLQDGKLVLELSGPRYGADGDDQVPGAEGPLALGELLDCRAGSWE